MNLQRKLISADDFLAWRQDQPGRWELVGGTPVQMLAGAKQRHDRIVVNLIAALSQKLKGGPCRPWTADIATRIPNGNVRQPDVTVDRGSVRDEALDATAPTTVFEVLSPSTRTFDQVRKVDEYKRVETMRHIVLIDPDRPRAILWSRDGDLWSDIEIDGLEGTLDLTAVRVSLSMADVYDGVTFEE